MARRRAGSRPADPRARWRGARSARPSARPAKLPGVRVDASVVVVDGARGLEGDARGDAPLAEVQERRAAADRRRRTARTGVASKTRLWSPPGVSGNRPPVAPAPLVELDEAGKVGERVRRVSGAGARPRPRRDAPCAAPRGAPSCPACRGTRRTRRPRAAWTTGQTPLCSVLTVQPQASLAAPERTLERTRGRVPRSGGGAGRRRPKAPDARISRRAPGSPLAASATAGRSSGAASSVA